LRKNYRPKIKRRFYILNERINAQTIRLIDYLGKQVGVFSRYEALNLAREKGLDLVLIAPFAQPPVVKLIDFKKFLYQENKKQKKAKKGFKKSLTKDIKLTLFVGPNDLGRLVDKAKEFIKDGHQVRLKLLLRGREITKKAMAFELINRFISLLGDVNISTLPKLQGKVIICVVSKKK
jgi:translation initiation factor IF-3